MKIRIFLVVLSVMLLCCAGSVSADESMPNPSLYSAGDLSVKLTSYWLANYIEVQELMTQFPDFQCTHYSNDDSGAIEDQIVCSSVNNERARDVIINFYFTGDLAGMTGLQQAVFTIGTPQPKDFQEVLIYFWQPEAFPWQRETDWFHDTMTSLMFYTPNTALRFDLPYFDREGDHFTTVDLWDSNASRLGVG